MMRRGRTNRVSTGNIMGSSIAVYVYACVEGPEFDAQKVDFKQLADRLAMYRDVEKNAYKVGTCMITGLAEAAGGDSPR